MRPILVPLGAVALVTTGCVEAAYTPSEFAPRAQPEPESHRVALPSQAEAIGAWQLPAGNPWAPYEKLTLLTALDPARSFDDMPDVMTLESVGTAVRAAENVAAGGLPPDTMWIVDARGAASVAFGSVLSRVARESVACVPTFNNWPAQAELVPAEETLAALVALPPRLPAADGPPSRPVFLLDSWRLAYKSEDIDEDVTDNRYMLSPADFPSPEDLRAHGIARIVYVVEDYGEVQQEEDDLNNLFILYRDAGIEIDLVDLAWLAGAPAMYTDVWYARVAPYRLWVVPRLTVVHDVRFYGRARGGFGGVHGAPPVHAHHPGGGGRGHVGGG